MYEHDTAMIHVSYVKGIHPKTIKNTPFRSATICSAHVERLESDVIECPLHINKCANQFKASHTPSMVGIETIPFIEMVGLGHERNIHKWKLLVTAKAPSHCCSSSGNPLEGEDVVPAAPRRAGPGHRSPRVVHDTGHRAAMVRTR